MKWLRMVGVKQAGLRKEERAMWVPEERILAVIEPTAEGPGGIVTEGGVAFDFQSASACYEFMESMGVEMGKVGQRMREA